MTPVATKSRFWSVDTPLGGEHFLLLVGFAGHEGISQLFQFQVDLVASNNKEVPFEKLLGQKVRIGLVMGNNQKRYFHGICSRISQGVRDATVTAYRMEVVPECWLLTRRSQSRIFQHLSVPEILKEVLTGIDVAFEIQGTFQPRDYCVQYRETDFNFASRLMEEEGIYYFFKHTADGHKLVLANTPQSHPEVLEQSKATFQEMTGGVLDDRVHTWEKNQELRSGRYTLWDHSFELPHQHLQADAPVPESVQVGRVTHRLDVAGNDKLEIYDHPGGYAQRFDGVDRGGGDRATDLQHIFEDNKRTVGIRMQEETLPSLVIHGTGNCRTFRSGHRFTLERHFNGDGPYLLVTVEHAGKGTVEGHSGGPALYHNSFTCIPAALAFRPPRRTPRPFVQGTQTAVVVGPPNEEIFTDKYGRVKVQFHWDRAGGYDSNSSCWIRVATPWAGKQWGMVHIPRIGQEVIVAFLEGDPDNPIIVGSAYNAEQMPPYGLPDNRTQSGIKSRSSLEGEAANFNEIRFEDKNGSEMVSIHAERDLSVCVENDETHTVGHDRKKTIDHDETTHVKNDRSETVDRNETITIHGQRTETVGQNETITVSGNRTCTVEQNEVVLVALTRTHTVGINEMIIVGAAQGLKVGGTRVVSVGQNQAISVAGSQTESIGESLTINAGEQILIQTGDASILMKKDGTIRIKGKDILVEASGKISARAGGDMVLKANKIGQN
jgi:type VI secretion system secreted protein VgrG